MKQALSKIVAKLQSHYGKPPPPKTTDPFGLILQKYIAYLTPDEKRDAAFDALRKRVGLKPTKILAAPEAELIEIARLGGMHPEMRVARLQESALIVLNDFDGDLKNALKLPLPKAKKGLQAFPGVGAPVAEKILLFTRSYPVLGLESNGLRVLLRLGFGEEKKNYASSYASVQDDLKDQIGTNFDFLIRAHQFLRQHGQELCRRSKPKCELCPLQSGCAYYLNSIKTRRPI